MPLLRYHKKEIRHFQLSDMLTCYYLPKQDAAQVVKTEVTYHKFANEIWERITCKFIQSAPLVWIYGTKHVMVSLAVSIPYTNEVSSLYPKPTPIPAHKYSSQCQRTGASGGRVARDHLVHQGQLRGYEDRNGDYYIRWVGTPPCRRCCWQHV